MNNTMITHPRASWISPETGKTLPQKELLETMAQKQVVLLGESHDVAEIHRWQLNVATQIYAYRPNMMMGFEMFPVSVQPVLDEWVSGTLSVEELLEKTNWATVWGFPPEIYLPLFHFCRQQNIRMLALNCYRALVTRVGKEGWDAIPEDERDGLTPSAPPMEGHREYLKRITGGRIFDEITKDIPDRFIRAQQTWDRAFACNIVNALNQTSEQDQPIVIGIMGRGHVEYGFGTPHQLRDLGIEDIGILLPTRDWRINDTHTLPSLENEEHELESIAGIADGIFRLDQIEAPAIRNKQESL